MGPWLYFEIQEGWTIVNLGAGNPEPDEVMFAHLVGDRGLVIMVDPKIGYYKGIVENIMKYKLKNVIPLPFAIWDSVEVQELKVSGKSTSIELTARWNPEKAWTQPAITVTWDYLVEILGLDHVDYAKVNVEGAEMQMLLGMNKILPAIEEHSRHYPHPKEWTAKFLSLLKVKGYNYGRIGGERSHYIWAKQLGVKDES